MFIIIWAIMSKQELTVLRELVNAVDQANFDLDVWKIKASLLIRKIFGSTDEKVALIEALHYDYSSWSLRDKTGIKQPDTVKEQAKGILEAAISELTISNQPNNIISEFQKHLTGSEMDQLQQYINEKNVDEKALMDFFSQISPLTKDRILARLIFDKEK